MKRKEAMGFALLGGQYRDLLSQDLRVPGVESDPDDHVQDIR